MATRPPGWYVDPDLPRLQRYWDGTEWTKDRRMPPSHRDFSPGWPAGTGYPR